MSDRPGDLDLPDLDLPDDLTVDAVTVDRLARQLASAPENITGIVAVVDDLPAGASTRSHAEWRSLAPFDRTVDVDPASPGGGPEGAVLRRRGASPDDGLLRVDPGAVSHRRSISAAPDEDAGPEGRSPFPWRPIVLFLALGDPGDDVVARLLDGLLDADVEPRLATPAAGTAARRHRPCAPTAATVERLAPDVLVALDAAALEVGPGWCTRRGTVVIDMTSGDMTSADMTSTNGIELVSWRIGTHPGRLRARVARTVEPAELARLVNRLAAGPQPVAPRSDPAQTDAGDTRDIRVDVADRPAPARRMAVVGPTYRPLLDSLADRTAAAGHRVERDRADARDADVVFVAAEALDNVSELVAERAAAGRSTVAVVEDGSEIDHGRLPEGLVAVSTDAGVIDRLRQAGIPGLRLPVMTATDRYQALRAAADLPVTPSSDVIGWTILHADDGPGPDDAGVAATLVALLDERPDLSIEVDADPDQVPEALGARAEVTLLRDPDPGEQARRRVHLLTTATGASSAAALTVMLASAHIGVPTLVSATTARTVGALADPRLVVPSASDGGPASPQAWADLLRRLLDAPEARNDRDGRSARARACAEALDAPDATNLVISRLLGWLDRQSHR